MKIQSIALFAGLLGLVAAADPQRCAKQDDCPGGYSCNEVNKDLKECIRIDSNGKPGDPKPTPDTPDTPGGGGDDDDDDDDDDKPDDKPNDQPDDGSGAFTAVVGSEDVEPRLPIHVLQTDFPDVFNMYVLALAELQSQPESSDLSYYGLSGIHGAPFIAWQEPPKPDVPFGYCTHDSVLFCTWHRPYLLLMEQQIIKTALTLAAGFGGDAEKYTAASKKIRLPYWDWAADDTRGRIPDAVVAQQIEVIKPSGSETITNPLYSYHFTNDQFRVEFFQDFPQEIYKQTFRRPTGSPPVSREDLVSAALQSTFQSRKDATFQLFSIDNFSRFSSTRFPDNAVPLDWASVEGIHDIIHSTVGSTRGHMSVIPVAAFDPIFWLHHVQVDRLAAIYQAIHPGSVIEPLARTRPNYGYPTEDGVEDINTILYPFKHQDSQYWTSNDVSAAESTHKYGYAYPEIPSNLAGEELRSHAVTAVHALYGPNTDTPNFNETDGGALKRTEWLAHISFDESQIDGTFTVWVYIGDVAAGHEDSLSGKALVGGCASFSGGVTLTKRSIVAGTVPLTQAMANEGVKVSGRKADVVAYLRKNLKWKVMQGTKELPTSALPSLEIGVSASDVKYYTDASKMPEYGRWATYYDATHGKDGALKPERGHLVASDDIVSANSSTSDPARKKFRLAKKVYIA